MLLARQTILAALAVSSLFLPAQAQTVAGRGERAMEQWDADGDGKVTPDEARAQRGTVYDALDADGNDDLTADEIEDAQKRLRDRLPNLPPRRREIDLGSALSALDSDGNGKLTKAEYLDATPRWFERRDSNGDGVLTASEFERGAGGF